jgi:hypothetical protein
MSSVTQRVPNILRGISQQPDNRKFPGQVRDAVNAYPDYALGLLKRPGGRLVSELPNAEPGGRWFNILRDVNEKYVGQFSNNIFRIWSLTDGTPRVVDQGLASNEYTGTCNLINQSTDLTAYRDAVAATKAALSALQTAEKNYINILAKTEATETPLFETTQNNQYSVSGENYTNYQERETLTSGALLNKEGTYTVKDGDVVVATTTSLPFPAGPGPTDTVYDLGSERTEEHPNLASQGYRVFQVIKTEPAEFHLLIVRSLILRLLTTLPRLLTTLQ